MYNDIRNTTTANNNTNDGNAAGHDRTPSAAASRAEPSGLRNRRRRRRSVLLLALGAAGLAGGAVSADTAGPSTGAESVFAPITPCRLLDTRPGRFNVGTRSVPIGPGETHVQPVAGSHGDCDLPPDVTGVAVNATAVGGTAASFATFYPADAERPNSSNLNWVAQQPPTPNKVDVRLSADGQVAIYNAFGTVDIVVDVVGFYVPAQIDELEQDAALLEQAAASLRRDVDELHADRAAAADDVAALWDHHPVGDRSFNSGTANLPASPVVIALLGRTQDVPGQYHVNSVALASSMDEAGEVRCSLSESMELETDALQVWQAAGSAAPYAGQLVGTRQIDALAGESVTIRLVCQRQGDAVVNIANAHLTMIFVPYAPGADMD